MKISGRRPKLLSSASDICTGIQYDAQSAGIATLIQTKSKQWRTGPKVDDFYDIMLLILTT